MIDEIAAQASLQNNNNLANGTKVCLSIVIFCILLLSITLIRVSLEHDNAF